MAVNLPKIADTPYLSLYSNLTKQNDNVTMTFPVNSSLQCFRTAALSMVTLNMESPNPMGRVNAENHSKMWKILRCQWVKIVESSSHGKLKSANSCWQTPKIFKIVSVFTKQTSKNFNLVPRPGHLMKSARFGSTTCV